MWGGIRYRWDWETGPNPEEGESAGVKAEVGTETVDQSIYGRASEDAVVGRRANKSSND